MFFDFDAPLFWYKLIFVVELMIAEAFATYTLKKRRRFALRVLCSVATVLVVAFLFPVFFVSPIVNTVSASVMFFSLFGVTVVALKFCYDEKFVTLFFCGVVAYTTQHIAYSTYHFLVHVTGIKIYDFYGNMAEKDVNFFSYIFYFGSYSMIYWFVWAFVEHKIREQEKLKIEPILLGSFAAILFVDVVLSLIVTYLMSEELSKVGYAVIYLYKLATCLLVYIVLYSVLGKRIAEAELETVESLWEQDRKNFEFSKENIELINIKCHDLKHQIRKIKKASGCAVDEAYLSELEKSVSIYDNSIKTGNEALDLIFAENSIFMAKHKIKFSVMAEDHCLDFLSDADLYSLFGNALNNAMEAVCKEPDEEKRVIRLRVYNEGKTAVIHMENYCREVSFGKDGLPKTDKQERGHGYGMRSMKMIAEKYGGLLTAEIKNEVFYLVILIPVRIKEV